MGQFLCHCDTPLAERHDFFKKHIVLFDDRNLSATELHIDRDNDLWIARRRLSDGWVVCRRRCILLNFADKNEVWIAYGKLHDMITIKFRETSDSHFVVDALFPQRTWLVKKRQRPKGFPDHVPESLDQLLGIVYVNNDRSSTKTALTVIDV